jgi:hypothetical protein
MRLVRSAVQATVLTAVLSATFSGSLAAQDIAIDAVHGYWPPIPSAGTDPWTSSFFADFRAELVALGFTLHPRTVFGAAELQGMEAVVLMNPHDAERYTDGEITAIANFAENGGGVLILSMGSSPLSWNFAQLLWAVGKNMLTSLRLDWPDILAKSQGAMPAGFAGFWTGSRSQLMTAY